MSPAKSANSRRVYSTDSGRHCPQCQRPVGECVCGRDRPASVGDGIVRLHRESKGRGGKSVTVIRGLPVTGSALKTLAKELKQRCGTGGAVKEDNIEIQGDQRSILKAELERRGFQVKLAGG